MQRAIEHLALRYRVRENNFHSTRFSEAVFASWSLSVRSRRCWPMYIRCRYDQDVFAFQINPWKLYSRPKLRYLYTDSALSKSSSTRAMNVFSLFQVRFHFFPFIQWYTKSLSSWKLLPTLLLVPLAASAPAPACAITTYPVPECPAVGNTTPLTLNKCANLDLYTSFKAASNSPSCPSGTTMTITAYNQAGCQGQSVVARGDTGTCLNFLASTGSLSAGGQSAICTCA